MDEPSSAPEFIARYAEAIADQLAGEPEDVKAEKLTALGIKYAKALIDGGIDRESVRVIVNGWLELVIIGIRAKESLALPAH